MRSSQTTTSEDRLNSDSPDVRSIVDAGEPLQASAPARMAYLLSRYPAISHTFFLNEVLGLRSAGWAVETISINPPDRPRQDLPPAEQQEMDRTFYLKQSKLKALQSLMRTGLLHPAVVLRGLQAWWRIDALTLRDRLFWLFYLAEALILGDHLRKKGLSHLHVHFGGAVASVGMLTSLAWRIPYSLTIHGPEELLSTDAYHLQDKTAQARFVICISDFCKSQLYQFTPARDWHKFHVVRLGVDPLRLCPAASPGVTTAPHTPHLVCTGRLVPAKGHRILLEALLRLRDQGLSFTASIVGDGPERHPLEQFVRDHALADRIYFAGALSHPETIATVRQADIFVLASFAEGIPVAIMEAMSLGIACISTTIAGIPELIESGIDGLLVPPANVPSLASALRSLLDDAPLRQRLGHAGRQRVVREYNLAPNLNTLAAVFQQYLPTTKVPTRRSN